MNVSARQALPVVSSGHAPRAAGAPVVSESLRPSQWLTFLLAHVVLGIVTFQWPAAATPHAWATLAFALWIVLSRRPIADVAVVAAYIVGAEVLWRMRGASTFWELGKYAVAGLLLIALARRTSKVSVVGPLAYFALLLPSVWLTIENTRLDLGLLRDYLSFNLSGPFALAVCACFFRQVTLSRDDFAKIAIAAIAPIISIATLTVLATYTATDLVFSALSSNAVTSAGFGPNQVSAILGLGALLSFLLLTTGIAVRRALGVAIFTALVVCAVQSAMTFSRGGLYMSVGAIAGSAAFLARQPGMRGRVLLVATAAAVTFTLIWPVLSRATGGMLAQRFEDVETTGRAELARSDLDLFAGHPLMGIGPGLAMHARAETSFVAAAHTEWTRVLAEHGLFGLLSIGVLLAIMAGNMRSASNAIHRGIVVALVIWSIAFLFAVAMRLVAPAFLLGLSCATFRDRPAPTHARRAATLMRRSVVA